MTTLLERDEIAETHITTSNEPADSAHIVRKVGDESPQALVLRARIEGIEVEALCGYTWVPQKDPAVLPVCAACLDIYKNGYGHDGEDMPDA